MKAKVNLNLTRSVAELLVERLSKDDDRLSELKQIAAFGNSFEGWVKWELALAAAQEWGCRPWESQDEDATWSTVGVEYTAPLATRTANRLKKKVDLWVCPGNGEKHVYVELKVVFKYANRGKQFASALEDLACLRALAKAEPADDRVRHAGSLVLVVAVGFEKAELVAESEGGTVHWLGDSDGAGRDETPSVAVVSFVA
jgi:hypothetical protein